MNLEKKLKQLNDDAIKNRLEGLKDKLIDRMRSEACNYMNNCTVTRYDKNDRFIQEYPVLYDNIDILNAKLDEIMEEFKTEGLTVTLDQNKYLISW